MFKKIENYFRDRYIIKTYTNASHDINSNELEYSDIIQKYDIKNGLDDRLLTYSILRIACDFKFEANKEIVHAVLYLYLKNLKEAINFSNRREYVEIYKLKLEKTFIEKKLNNISSLLTTEFNVDFSPVNYSKENFDDAMKIVQNLIDNNEEYLEYHCKSYKTLKYSKTNIELAFNYLLDSVKFDENSPLFNNKDFTNNLNGLHMHMLLTYFDVDIKDIPKDKLEQIKFKSFNTVDFGKNQLEITKLITWRNKKQWLHFANVFGIESEIGKLCLENSQK